MKDKKWQFSIAIICLIMGLLLGVQFRTQERIDRNLGTQRAEDLITALKKAEKKRDSLQAEVASLRKKIDQYQETSVGKEGREELIKYRLESGTMGIRGAGILVTLNENANMAETDGFTNVIQDVDLLKTVNEIWASGAEAVSVNGQRVVAMSGIKSSGYGIMINNERLSPPYVIKAIGDPATLESALRMPGGVAETFESYGIQMEIEQQQDLHIPPYKGSMNFEFAKVWEEGKD